MKFYKKTIIWRKGKPYLIRYSLFSCRYFAVKIHKILQEDDACLHDHPWAFVTMLLKGSYAERSERGWRVYSAGRILYRPANYLHRLAPLTPCVWTFVITFRKTRQWGFMTSKGWVFWTQYHEKGGCE